MLLGVPARWAESLQRASRRHLEWIFRVTSQRPFLVVLCTLILVVLAIGSITTTRFETDIFKLFPGQRGPLQLFLQSLDWSGGAREAYFLLEGPRERLIPGAETFAGRLRALRVEGRPAFSRVNYRVVDSSQLRSFERFVAFAVANPQAFLAPADLAGFTERLTPGAMDQALTRAGSELASQMGMEMRGIIAADPLYLRELILPRLKAGSQGLDLDPASPYFLSRDGQVLIIIAEPVRPVNDMDFARQLVVGINAARAGSVVSISCTGAHLSAVLDEAVMKRNIVVCILSSLLVVLGLFYFSYRRLLPTLLLPLILCCGVVLALGFAGLLLSSVNIISFAFMALIIGLGTDYSIHLYDRFHSERSRGLDSMAALHLAVVDTGHGLFTAATTTALPFLALTIADVRALAELGLLVGLGVLFSLYATLFFLPPLLLYSEKRLRARPYRPLPSFGLGRLWDVLGRMPRPVSLVSGLLVSGLLIASFGISFEGELKNLQPRQSEAFLTQEKMERHLNISPKQMLVALDGQQLEPLMARASRVEAVVDRYRLAGQLRAWSSLGQVLNSPQLQQTVVQRLSSTLDRSDPAANLRAALERHGFSQAAFRPAMAGLEYLRKAEPIPLEQVVAALEASPLRGVLDRHLVRDGEGRSHLLLYLHYREGEFRQDAFLRELSAVDPMARATSVDLVSEQLIDSVRKSFFWGMVLGGGLVLFLLLAHFSSLRGVVYTLVPVVSGVIAMLGLMPLTGMRLNFMNAMVLVTILGMGSDYGLHVLHRVTGTDVESRRGQFIQAGRAVLLSAVTTIAGFGSLAFTDYGAMSSIGWATNYGVAATALFALVSLPACTGLVRHDQSQGGGVSGRT